MVFAFKSITDDMTDDMVLAPIGEDEESEMGFAYETSGEDVSKADVQRAKAKTEILASAAKKDLSELSSLLNKLKTGTATREEKDRLKSLHAKIDGAKEEIERAKAEESTAELRMLRSSTSRKTTDLMKAIKMKDIRSSIRAVCKAESVDLVFLIDCTGSMSPHIEAVKNSVREIVRRIRATNGNLKLRLALVGYRDLCDSDKCFEVLNFVSAVAEFESFVASLKASGGGDAPEDIAGAAQQANSLAWEHTTRVMFLIGDAPCHGTEFHSFGGGGDSHPRGTPGISIISELKALAKKKTSDGSMTFTFGRINDSTDIMVNRFKAEGIEIDVVDITDTKKLSETVTTTVRKSVFKTMTVMGGTATAKSVAFAPVPDVASLLMSGTKVSASLKSYTIVPDAPRDADWTKYKPVSVKVYRNRPVKSFKDLREPIDVGILEFLPDWATSAALPRRTDKTKESTMYMLRAAYPFAEGEIRLAYHGLLERKVDALLEKKNSMVMKAYKHVGKGVNSRLQYFKQMEVSTISRFLAKGYNKSHRPDHCAEVHVLPVCVVEEIDDLNEETGSRRFCAEAALPSNGSEFIKFSNNTGHWNEDHLDETLLRFTKFTHEKTRGYLMVTDLQGVLKGSAYHLTDPVILCKDVLRFGTTNLGGDFMKKCIDATEAYLSENGWA